MKTLVGRFMRRERVIDSRNSTFSHAVFTSLLAALVSFCLVSISHAAIFKTDAKWPSGANGETRIRVCIDPLSASNQGADASAHELPHENNPTGDAVVQRVRKALRTSWEANSSVRFYGWEQCDKLSEDELEDTLKVSFQRDRDSYYDAQLKQVNLATSGKADDRCISADSKKAGVEYSDDCAEQDAIREFGHALGFANETRSYAADRRCHDEANPVIPAEDKNYVYTTKKPGSYDADSIMASGSPDCAGQDGRRSGTRTLSMTDIKAVQQAYPMATSSLASSELYFGGMYGSVNNGSPVYNPATNAQTCPIGYTNREIYGTSWRDWSVNLCYRERSAAAPGEQAALDFGGMWGYIDGNSTNNPVTGTNSCPVGFDSIQLLNTSGLDWPLFLCYRKPAANPPLKFGGTITYKNAQPVPNQVTGKNACPLGYAEQAVLGTSNMDWPFSFCYGTNPKQVDGLDFGGAYGYINNGSPVVNPITNAMSCPSGYSAVQAFGTSGLDWPIFMCYKPHIANTKPDYDFGGMWGYINNGTLMKNPVTGGASCAAGYTRVKVLGTSNQDWEVSVCYRTHRDDSSQGIWFGGVIGTVEQRTVNNPATQAKTCPPGYVTSQLLGTNNQDWPLFFCYAAPDL